MFKYYLSTLTSLTALFVLSGSCFATVRAGIKFPDHIFVGGHTLRLNGVGLLQKTIFKADVYVAGLYLQNPTRQEKQILSSGHPKEIVMVFLRDVSSGQLTDAIKDEFHKACDNQCGEYSQGFAQFASLLKDVHKGQEIRFTFYPNHLKINSVGIDATIQDGRFAKMFLATFIGKHSAEGDVRRGLLSLGTT